MTATRRSIPCRRRAAGFTVVELAVSLLVMVIVTLGLLALFDFSNRLSSVQSNVSEMQQSQRIAQQDVMRTIRMMGRGSIPLEGSTTSGFGLAVWDQVPADTQIGGSDTPDVLPGTDILTVRGVFSSPMYQVNALAPGTFAIQTTEKGFSGSVVISNLTPTSIPQDLQPLKDALDSDQDDLRLVLVNARDLGKWSIVALDLTDSSANLTSASLKFTALPVEAPPEHFVMPTGDPLGGLSSVAFVGILEEHRFYIRQDRDHPKIAPNGTQDLAATFTRARVVPGTDRPWRDDLSNLKIDVADNIVDLQVALGYDSPRGGGRITDDANGEGDDDRIYESADGEDDDWMYNSVHAIATDQPVDPLDWAGHKLYFVRLTTLARTDRRDKWYQSPALVRLEDHDLTASQFNSQTDRMFRYRPLQTFIDMRNLN